MRNRILFIGGAGFIGSALIKRFLEDDRYYIYVLEPERANTDRLKAYQDNITMCQGDINDSATVLKIIVDNKIDTVVHLASTLIPGSSLPHFQNEMNNIILPTMYLMELCSENNIKFIYFSSGGTVYGNNKGNRLHLERDEKEPISYYGLSKNILEEMIGFEHRRTNLKYLILRPSNPYGYGQNIYGKQGIIAVSIGKILKGEPITVWGDGNAVRDYIYIDDLAEIVYQLVNSDIVNEVINIGSGVGYSINQIIKILDSLVDVDIKVDYVPSRGVDVDSLILDVSKLQTLINFNLTEI
ncbi:MAG: epimerase, partial [Bacteroidales bacterium 45-6]|uniref:NAD-dependent epimerase/dehydratase family protein n=1 Tax=uncultured Dysgonomonas sp. TaxID=206096 RepID=UPI00095E4632